MRFNYKILGLVMFVMLICCVSAASAADADNIAVPDDADVIEVDDAVDSVDVVEIDDNVDSVDELISAKQDTNLNNGIILQNNGENPDDSNVIYVGSNITDGGNGSYDNPFSNFTLACNNVINKDNVTIKVFNGTYTLGSILKFNTSNLNIEGLGQVIIKVGYAPDDMEHCEAFGLTSTSANFTFSNIIFDASSKSIAYDFGPDMSTFFFPFYGRANLGIYNNCTFLSGDKDKFNRITGSEYNSIFINCDIEVNNGWSFIFQNEFVANTNHEFTYCVINSDMDNLQTIHLPINISMDSIWFGKNTLPSYITPSRSFILNPDGSYNSSYTIPVNRYAQFSVHTTYLGADQYEIVGKLTWNGTDNQDGMENFQPMMVTLESVTGDINLTATLVNGNFKTIYRSNSSDNKITATLHSEEIELEFTKVNITANPVSIYYGEDQNITFNFTQPITANVIITVSNGSYNKSEEVSVINKDSIIYMVPDILKNGSYTVEISLADKNLFGFNTTTLTVSQVNDYTFEVATKDVKFGENATISITLPADVNGTVIVKLGNDTKELPANHTMTVNFTNLNATTYNVNVSYSGNDKYVALDKPASVTVNKADSILEIEDATFTYGDVISIPFNVTNANGVTVSVLNKDEDEVATASSESGTINLDALPAGKYFLEATTIVGSKYEWVSKTIDLTINKANSSIDIQDKEFVYAAEAIINTVTENSTGDVIATLTDENNTEIAVTVSGDDITLPKLNTGKYTLTVTTNPDENHNNVTKTATITINKAAPSMNVIIEPVENITTKDNVTLTISLPSDATGEVTVKINGKKIDIKPANETITVNLNNQVAGDCIVDIIYSGNLNYESDIVTKEFVISKLEASITAKQIDFEEGNASKIEVTVPDVESGIVLVDVAGKKFYGDIENGKVVITLEGVSEGNYTANIKFFGDDKCNPATTTADVKVSEDKIITELKEQLEEANAKVDNLTGELANASDKIADLTAGLNETQANATKLSEDLADAQANVTKLSEDLADANAKVDNLTAELEKAKLLPTQFNVTNGFKLQVYAVDYKAGERGEMFNVLLTDSNGNPLANQTVFFAINGWVHNKTTDANGVAHLQINLQDANYYTCAPCYLGNTTYNATFASAMLEVVKKPITISAAAKSYKATAKTKKYTVTLKTIKGSSIDGKTYLSAGKKVTLKVNGKTYTAKINAKGQATFNLKITKKGKYDATIKFTGDKTYKAATKKVKITIK